MKKLSTRISKMEGKVLSNGPNVIFGSQKEIDAKIAEARLKCPGYQPPLVVFVRKFSELAEVE